VRLEAPFGYYIHRNIPAMLETMNAA
jgi:hypothetical protein